jgi:tRNA-specific 2-thiouridylase
MRVLVAMSGGVDSSVAAARVVAAGHTAVGVTLRLWGGESDSGCCSVADVEDARRAAHRLGIDHLVFNLADDFSRHVVGPYVEAHAAGRTPNPCIECNRHLKFDRLAERAAALGFDALATGHHAQVVRDAAGRLRVGRGADRAKDQSYVVHVLDAAALARTQFPIGHLTKAEVRAEAARLGLPTATKPDSQDVCFITSTGGRRAFLGARIPLRPAEVVTADGTPVGRVDAVELVTIGQRRGLGLPGGGEQRYVVAVHPDEGRVVVGSGRDLHTDAVRLERPVWPDGEALPAGTVVRAQVSAHGAARPAVVEAADAAGLVLRWVEPQRRVAPGQSVVLYDTDDTVVLGAGLCA